MKTSAPKPLTISTLSNTTYEQGNCVSVCDSLSLQDEEMPLIPLSNSNTSGVFDGEIGDKINDDFLDQMFFKMDVPKQKSQLKVSTLRKFDKFMVKRGMNRAFQAPSQKSVYSFKDDFDVLSEESDEDLIS